MSARQQKLVLNSYSGLYGLIIPKDDLLRKISELRFHIYLPGTC